MKTIARLRTLVQKYYISHPGCRFSLRILPSPLKSGTKARAEDVVYAPSKSVQEAVQKAVGKGVAAACEWIDTSSAAYAEALAEGNVEADEDPIVLEAFLPKPATDPAVICKKPNCTHFISVDSRSVSCARGTLKQIHTLYKSYLKSASLASGLSDPFVYLNICCPPGIYDPNIEPAKDDVLFNDGDAVVRVIEKMLMRFYGELKTEERVGKGKVVGVTQNGFELLLARKPTTLAKVVTSPSKERWPKPLSTPRQTETTGYGDVDEDEEEMAAMAVDMIMQEEMETGGFVASNNSSTSKQPKEMEGVDDGDQSMEPEDGPVPAAKEALTELEQVPTPPEPGTGAPASNIAVPGASPLVTPRRKTTGWGFNMSGGLSDSDSDEPIDRGLELHDSDNEEAVRRNITLSNPWTAAKMNTPIVSSAISSSPASTQRTERLARGPFNPLTRTGNRRGSSPVSPENAARGMPDALPTPANSPSARTFRENRGSMVRVRPGKEPTSGNMGLMDSWVSRAPCGEARSPPRIGFASAATLYKQTAAQEDGDDDDDDDDDGCDSREQQQKPKRPTRAREPTKRTAPEPGPSKRRRLDDNTKSTSFTSINDPARPRSSPHRNRFLAATAALSTPGVPPSHDLPPRGGRRRTKTLLPLDAVPELPLQTHQLSQTVDLVAADRLRYLFKHLRESDTYVGATTTGVTADIEGMFFSDCAAWGDVTTLGGLVKQWMLGLVEGQAELMEKVAATDWEIREEGEGGRVLRVVEVGELEE